MANPSLQIGNDNWAIKEDNLLGYSTAGTRFVPQPITMTRATASTRVNPSGLVEDVALLGSEEVTNGDFSGSSTGWSESGTWTYGNNNEVCTGNGTNQMLTQSGILTSGKLYTYSIDIISSALSSQEIRVYVGGTDYTTHILSGVAETISGNTVSAGANLVIRVTSSNTSGVLTIDNISVKEATIDNLPRVDYTDGTSSLLVEPQRTNLLPYSEAITQANGYSPSGVTFASNQGTTPMGTNNATKLTSTGTDPFIQYVVPNTNATFTLSVYAKGVGSSVGKNINFFLVRDNYAEVAQSSQFTLTNEWVRYTATLSLSTNPTTQVIYRLDAPSVGVAGDEVLIWGAQIEQGSYPTSYIKTSGSTVTRNQETYTKTGISDLINSEEGVLFFEMAALSDDGTLRCITLSDGGITNRVLIIYDTQSNSIRAVVVSTAGTSFDELHTVTSTLDFHKIAIKWKLNDFALWIDGVEVATDTSGAAPIGLDRIVFDVGNGTYDFYGKVKQLQIFKTALSDPELVTLTT